jgi:hypothetical protein
MVSSLMGHNINQINQNSYFQALKLLSSGYSQALLSPKAAANRWAFMSDL